jgi:hypothetical protein
MKILNQNSGNSGSNVTDVVVRYLNTYYPNLPNHCLDGGELTFLGQFANDSTQICHILDHNRETMVWAKGTQWFGYLPSHWIYQPYLDMVQPIGYQLLHRRIAHVAYDLYFKHNLSRERLSLSFQNTIPLIDVNQVIYETIQVSWILIANEYGMPILTATRLFPIGEWLRSDFPIRMCPDIWLNNKQIEKKNPIIGLKTTLIETATQNFLKDLGLTDRQIIVCKGHASSMTNQAIAEELCVKISTVTYDNIEILNIFRSKFSTSFESAEKCVKYILRIGIKP